MVTFLTSEPVNDFEDWYMKGYEMDNHVEVTVEYPFEDIDPEDIPPADDRESMDCRLPGRFHTCEPDDLYDPMDPGPMDAEQELRKG